MARRRRLGLNRSRGLSLKKSCWIFGVIIINSCSPVLAFDTSSIRMLRLKVGVQAAFLGGRSRSLLSCNRAHRTQYVPRQWSPASELHYSRGTPKIIHPPIRRLFSTLLTSSKENTNDRSITPTGIGNARHEQVAEFLSQMETSLCEGILPQLQSIILASAADTPVNTDETKNFDDEMPTILLVGVSGGCDSIGLLHAILDTSNPDIAAGAAAAATDDEPGTIISDELTYPRRRFRRNGQLCELHVAHFDHCQRGIESQKDSQLVQDICQQHGLPCHIYHWDDDITDDEAGPSSDSKFSQDKARQWRQSTLTQLLHRLTRSTVTAAQENPPIQRCGVILTAHHANDSQETLLLKLLRGVHVQNLSGMADFHRMESTNTCYARPFLHLTKDQIKSYLEIQGYPWREDESNKSNKYLRNRVRNELIPLMQDLVGGETVLRKRLENLEEQCDDIRTDVSGRVQIILEQRVDTAGRFLLPESISDLAVREALYKWASQSTNKYQLSYELWKRVILQLTEYHNNRNWVLPLGEGWNIKRLGDALQIDTDTREDDKDVHSQHGSKVDPPIQSASLSIDSIPWSLVHELSSGQTSADTFLVKVPSHISSKDFNRNNGTINFVLSSARAQNWKFTPPWREGRSPLKLGSFLRGQKVPLHLRDTTQTIICEIQQAKESLLVAVLVNDKWVVDAAWNSATSTDEEASITQYIRLCLEGVNGDYNS